MSDGNDNWEDEPYEGEGQVATESEIKVKRPKRYKVLLHNDNYTTMEFVVLVLKTVFHLEEPSAVQVMLHVHRKGAGVAGVFSYEVAETKVHKVTELARTHDYPLRCSMEPAE